MKWINAYLMFDGSCREAMEFYKDCFGGELTLTNYTEEPMKDRVMHARLTQGGGLLMASDCRPGEPLRMGENVRLAIECDGPEEQDRIFAALGAAGMVTMALQDTFWGARFGMLRDKFDVHWMLNFDHPKG